VSALSIAQTKTAVGAGLTASFLASGGTAPYVYDILPTNAAGGSIDPSTGLYTAPSPAPTDPELQYDTIRATDNVGAQVTSQVLVGPPLLLFCDIIQNQLGLANGRVYLWDQKIFQPIDAGLYVAVAVVSCKPYSNNIQPALIASVPDWSESAQYTNFFAQLDVNIISRDTSALLRKEEVLMAFNSVYAEQQQDANSFLIGRISAQGGFKNLSMVDGAAIPYRYVISMNMQYVVTKQQPIDYFGTFAAAQITTNP
jgi:hypothetical protein